MKRTILPYVIAGYLGFALSAFADVYWFQWEFYATLIPIVILNSFLEGE